MLTRPRILFIVTHPMSVLNLMRGQLAFLASRGLEVAVATGENSSLIGMSQQEGFRTFQVSLRRSISPASDISSLPRLIRVIRQYRPHIVNASTPKAGLLGMLAGRAVGSRSRVYTLRGLRLETERGLKRKLLVTTEKVASLCAHRVVCVSESLRRRAVGLGLVDWDRTTVLGPGSSNGVDVEHYRPRGGEERNRFRRKLGIPEGIPVVGFAGRFTNDKGIPDLSEAFFEAVIERHPEARLLMLGEFEDGDRVAPDVRRSLEEDPRVVLPGFVEDPAPYYSVMDVLAFPSYREGFPNAPLEAAASGVPTVGYSATGTVDAVEDGVSGCLVPVGRRDLLGKALCRFLDSPQVREEHGRAGRERALRLFRRELVWERWLSFYQDLLEERTLG